MSSKSIREIMLARLAHGPVQVSDLVKGLDACVPTSLSGHVDCRNARDTLKQLLKDGRIAVSDDGKASLYCASLKSDETSDTTQASVSWRRQARDFLLLAEVRKVVTSGVLALSQDEVCGAIDALDAKIDAAVEEITKWV